MLSLRNAHALFRRVNAGGMGRFLWIGRPQLQGRVIRTLDPSRLLPSDCLNIAGVGRPAISTAKSSFLLPKYHAEEGRVVSFPADCHGFLYLSNAGETQSSWQIRFRVTDSDSPESFESGADLLRPNQEPWSVALKSLGETTLAALQELLRKDGLISNALPPARSWYKESIQTLDHSRLCPSDYLDLAGLVYPRILTQNSKFRVAYTVIGGNRIPFPPSARGFLYLHAPTEEPQIMWQIRFRVTDDSSGSFQSGSDLLYPNQTPWFISLAELKSDSKGYFALRELLVHDGLDIEYLADKCIAGRGPISKPMINHLGQLFHVDFEHQELRLTFVGFGEGSALERRMTSPLCAHVSRSGTDNMMRENPYAGSALCCFDAHPSPTSTRPNTLTLRINENGHPGVHYQARACPPDSFAPRGRVGDEIHTSAEGNGQRCSKNTGSPAVDAQREHDWEPRGSSHPARGDSPLKLY